MAKFSGSSGLVKIGSAVNISSATYDAGVVTVNFAAVHGLVAGDRVNISNVVGMTDINGQHTVATAPDTDTITIAKTTAQSYSSGGTGQRIVNMTGWNITKALETKKVTDSSSSGGNDYIPDGYYDIEGSFKCYAEQSITVLDTDGSIIALRLDVNANNYWSGNAIITSVAETLEIAGGNPDEITYNFKGTGAWSRAVGA